jgi:hypothetical protein
LTLVKTIMSSDPNEASHLGPEAREALHQLRDGIRRARKIVREAKQAIGQAPPEGALLSSAPSEALEEDNPVIRAD